MSEALMAAYARILLQTEPEVRPGIRETPARAAKAWEELTSGYAVDVDGLFKTFDADGYDEMICVRGIPFTSLCEHHMLPFVGEAHVVYLPNGKVVGLSKVPRVVDAFARRLQQQERLTMQVADAIERNLGPLGVMVVCEAHHACMSSRGVRSKGTMRTSVTRGLMRTDAKARGEADSLIFSNGRN